jgi:hypothetical protein
MAGMEEQLKRLWLSEYLEVLTAEGFDTWRAVLNTFLHVSKLDITESDL